MPNKDFMNKQSIKTYKAEYTNSYALIIGINDYFQCSPLNYARQDAESIAEVLEHNFSFPHENIKILLDSKATKEVILSTYLNFAQDENIKDDDRILVYFAGHGMTRESSRGEVGYLVPVDGKPNDITTLIRWDDFTRNADIIPAKHILFIMDACYGGLAFVRQPSFGAMRFLKDMLRRKSRQVLTAGKADETVSDGNGVRPGHSIFTAHLLNALEGAAASKEGLITANGIMAYVYEKVSSDQYSHQTPHFGFIDGDGDFIFDSSKVAEIIEKSSGYINTDDSTEEIEKDILINTSQVISNNFEEEASVVESIKELLSDPGKKIQLNDFVIKHIKLCLEKIDLRNFPVQGVQVNNEDFYKRIKNYEEAVKNLQYIVVLITQWGDSDQIYLLQKILARIAETDKGSSGLTVWLNLSWYPIQILMYSAGITAISAHNYKALRIVLETPITTLANVDEGFSLNTITVRKLSELNTSFKCLPGHERQYVPRSEYLFKQLQPLIEDLLFLGRSYEEIFDKYEIFSALVYANETFESGSSDVRGPVGRFGYKFNRPFRGENPITKLEEDAVKYKEKWQPLLSGFFNGDYERFKELMNAFKNFLGKLSWF